MADNSQLLPSFSPGRKWRIGFEKTIAIVALLAIVVMVNYISHNFFFRRFFISSISRVQLSPQTLGLLASVTNQVKVTLYYDKSDDLFSTISALVNEYRLANPKISVETVDYLTNPGDAQKAKIQYKLDAPTDKNLVIFDCAGRVKMVNGDALMESTPERVPNDRELEFRKRPVAFKGEMVCSAMLLAVTSPKPLRACYLTGHGEHSPASSEEQMGYAKFAGVVAQNYITIEPLSLLGTNSIPADCAVMIIAGPKTEISEIELSKIAHYLDEGGRLFALFNATTVDKKLGLEKLLAKWGVNVTSHIVVDPQNARGKEEQDIVVKTFSKHPVVNALLDSSIHLILPREILRIESSAAADAPKVDEIALTGPNSTLINQSNAPVHPCPIAVAVEKGAVPGMANERGVTRIVVMGDSIALGNQMIDSAANRDFTTYVLNWLVDRPQLLQGLGPRPVTEFKLLMTRTQLRTTLVILLAGLPGVTLLVGFLVWLRRRN